MSNSQIIVGDCLEVMRTLDANSVDAVVTDPPYGLKFMGKRWDCDVPGVPVWAECLRVLKPGGHLLAFAGTRTQHRMCCSIEDAGFEIRDMLAWVYGSGFPKSLDVSKALDKAAGAAREVVGTKLGMPGYSLADNGRTNAVYGDLHDPSSECAITAPATDAAKQWQGWGTAIKPAWEPIIVARKPLVGTVAANVLAFGTGAINVDGCRVEYASDADKRSALSGDAFKRKDTSDNGWSRPWMNDAERVDRMNREAKERAQSGRWPANLIHDGSDEVTDLLGNAARFFYCAKASKKDRDEGLEGDEREAAAMQGNLVAGQPLSGDGRPITTPRRKNHHPTVKPTDLMRYLCRLITPPNGLILDPFTGSGSTGKAAMLEGFRFVGIEREAEYAEIAKARIAFSNVSDNSCPLFDSPIQKDAA